MPCENRYISRAVASSRHIELRAGGEQFDDTADQGVQFDGVNDYVTFGAAPSLGHTIDTPEQTSGASQFDVEGRQIVEAGQAPVPGEHQVVEPPVLAVVLGLLHRVGVGVGGEVGVGHPQAVHRVPHRGHHVGLGVGHEQRHAVGGDGQFGDARGPHRVEVVGPVEPHPSGGEAFAHPHPSAAPAGRQRSARVLRRLFSRAARQAPAPGGGRRPRLAPAY